MAQIAFADLGADEAVGAAPSELPPEHPLQVPVQLLVAANEARVHQRGLDHLVAPRMARTLGDRAGRMTHGQPGVPQGIEYPVGDELHVGRRPPAIQEQDVDVRVGIQLATAVPALGHHRAASPGRRRPVLLRGLEQAPQEAIDHLAVCPHHLHARRPRAMGSKQPLAPLVDVCPDALSRIRAPDVLVHERLPRRAPSGPTRRTLHVFASPHGCRHYGLPLFRSTLA